DQRGTTAGDPCVFLPARSTARPQGSPRRARHPRRYLVVESWTYDTSRWVLQSATRCCYNVAMPREVPNGLADYALNAPDPNMRYFANAANRQGMTLRDLAAILPNREGRIGVH